ncbi:MAG: LexA family transcriptional regulator [Sulfurospirillum sp.]|nr:LexA family transcriptional regulator [Sulfurospirillum sp.]
MFGLLVRKYRKDMKYTQGELAQRLEIILHRTITNENVRSWENGTNPKLDVIVAIAEILDIPEQFLFDDGVEKINKIVSKEMPNFKNIVSHTKKISLLDGYVGAGSAGIMDKVNTVDFIYIDNYMIKKAYQKEDVKGLTVVGDSMYPYINCCDIVLFAPVKDYGNLTDGKYIITTMAGTQLKNLSFRSNGDILISSCNKSYPDELIRCSETQENIDINGIVVGRILKS